VIVLAGPSGCGKTRLAERSGLPLVALDDFYRDGDAPDMPRVHGGDRIDWEDPASWDLDAAVAALDTLCRTGSAEVPTYSFGDDRAVGRRTIDLDGARAVVAEGIFAAEVVERCRRADLLADAIVLAVPAPVTFWRRLVRDLREARKPPLDVLRIGLGKARDERAVVARQEALGCRRVSKPEARALLASFAPPPPPAGHVSPATA